jgi:anti-sigma factor ChrR (cupin superfamily)
MVGDLVNADFSRRIVIATDELPWRPSPAHGHALGEEFLVLDGIFSDEHGDYPTGTYIRNPPGSSHSPRTAPGCTIFVKLRQMPLTEQKRTVIDTTKPDWGQGDVEGHARLGLYSASPEGERVTMEGLRAGAALPKADGSGGEEIFVVSGDLGDDEGTYGPGTWIRNPAGYRRRLKSTGGATYWAKRGHFYPTQ